MTGSVMAFYAGEGRRDGCAYEFRAAHQGDAGFLQSTLKALAQVWCTSQVVVLRCFATFFFRLSRHDDGK
jgi:hypothetical protein